jgi:hypothetical protein
MPISLPLLQDQTRQMLQWPVHKVYVRPSLKTGSWVEVPHLDPVQLVERASPGLSQAVLAFQAGQVLHPDETAFADHSPVDVIGKFV